MTRHVLLMLSTDAPPDPVAEIEWHVANCAAKGETVVATTALLGRLSRDGSIVAFYGNAALKNRLLGVGDFAGFGRLDQARGQELIARSPLYAGGNLPRGAQGALIVKNLRRSEPDATIDVLGGTIESTGLPLTEKHLPAGPARACVYFSGELTRS